MTSERGFTLAEVLVAAFLVAVGLAGLLASVPLGSFAVQEGKQVSTATFLANQKLEEVRHMPWKSLPANDCLGDTRRFRQSVGNFARGDRLVV